MKQRQLSRNELDRLQRSGTGALAEEIAADLYADYSTFRDAGEFDLATEAGGIGETKSTLSELANGNKGRFRLFKPQHEALVRKDRSGSAFYVFLLFDISRKQPVAKVVRRNPADIGNVIAGRGGFNQSGHDSGRQHKLPISSVF